MLIKRPFLATQFSLSSRDTVMPNKAAAFSINHLPSELYSEIAAKFQDPSDRRTLLSLALVDRIWHTHVRFLRAIVAQPNRLGPLVRSYAQLSLVSNFPNAPRGREGADLELWELTLKALPMFANLNQLEFVPQRHSVTSEATEVLSRFSAHAWRTTETSRPGACGRGPPFTFLSDMSRADIGLLWIHIGSLCHEQQAHHNAEII
ncbi:hypothetical protein D9619_012487 [Psilocybe cf. subviscida]|uniref:F-box domain-containing protein n=1 Tax=Psilocybe cf. subviscida TaxID=2480587 RepID=A0A8H5ARF8_9AGAR|nr:hypothetical protein D9619_012487 [Psilocybe cf. subviscida]